jgi:hypothetical protein
MNQDTRNNLYGLLREQLGDKVAEAMWSHWSLLSEEEAKDLYNLCMVEPSLLNSIAKLYATQIIALKSGQESDIKEVVNTTESLLDKVTSTLAVSDSYKIV